MVLQDVLKKLILILISHLPNEHRAHPQTPTRLDPLPRVTAQQLSVVAPEVLADIPTAVTVPRHMVVQVDTVIHPPQLELCPMEQNTDTIHTVSKMGKPPT